METLTHHQSFAEEMCHGTVFHSKIPKDESHGWFLMQNKEGFLRPQRFDGYKWCQDCGEVRMSVLYQRGWNGSSCPRCTRIAAVTVLRGLSSFLGQWSPAHSKIIECLVHLETWNADGWDRFFDPDDTVVSRHIESKQYQARLEGNTSV